MYVKCFENSNVLLCDFSEFSECHFLSFSNFPPFRPPYIPTSQGTEPRRQMPASAGGHYRGHCRREIAGAQDKVREEQIPEHGKPECNSGLPLVLHSGILQGRL
ncbi:unnamed protein product, partial [Staurois parvus]